MIPSAAPTYSFSEVSEALLSDLKGLNQVALTYVVKGSSPVPAEYFGSVDSARERISAILRDANVSNLWVGAQIRSEAQLRDLLSELSSERSCNCISTTGQHGKVFDFGLGKPRVKTDKEVDADAAVDAGLTARAFEHPLSTVLAPAAGASLKE